MKEGLRGRFIFTINNVFGEGVDCKLPNVSHGYFRVAAASLSSYINNLLIEHDRGWRVARETRERSVCDTFLIAWQLLCLAPL